MTIFSSLFQLRMSLEALLPVLVSSCSQNVAEVKWANERLAELSTQRGFFHTTTLIAVDSSLPAPVRLQAVLYLKNNIDAIWRRGPEFESLPPTAEEKSLIKSSLLSVKADGCSQVLTQVAVVISKIARLDVPHKWAELLPFLLDSVRQSQSHSDLISQHCLWLLIFYRVLKVLASKRLPPDRRYFKQLSAEAISPLIQLYRYHLQSLTSTNNPRLSESVECCRICFKAISIMIANGVGSLTASHDVSQLVSSLPEDVVGLSKLILVDVGALLTTLWKFIVQLQETFSMEFVTWLEPFLLAAYETAFSEQRNRTLPNIVTVKCLNLLKATLMNEDYKTLYKSDPTVPVETLKAIKIKGEFYTPDRLQTMCRLLISEYFLTTEADLEQLLNESEAYVLSEIVGSDNWRQELRPAAESFYVCLIHDNFETLVPVIVQWLSELSNHVDYNSEGDKRPILLKDSMLTALGLSASEMYDVVDFDSFFQAAVFPQVVKEAESHSERLIQRRLIWLCGKWVSVKFGKSLRPQLYEMLCQTLLKQADVGVCLTAVATLSAAVDDFDFKADVFEPFAPCVVESLLKTMGSCEESDSKLQVFNCLCLIAEVVGPGLKNSSNVILQCLPKLWESDEQLLKSKMLTLCGNLIKHGVFQAELTSLLPSFCQMVAVAVDLQQPSHVYLLEAGLDLWEILLETTSTPMPLPLLELFPMVLMVLLEETENIKVSMEIIKNYAAFRDPTFCAIHMKTLGEFFQQVSVQQKKSSLILWLKAIEFTQRCCPSETGEPLAPVVRWCVETVVSDFESLSLGVLHHMLTICARCCIGRLDVFKSLLSSFSQDCQYQFLSIWVEKTGSCCLSHDLERRKANAMALMQLCLIPDSTIEMKTAAILKNMAEGLEEICVVDEEKSGYADTLVDYDFGAGGLFGEGVKPSQNDLRLQAVRESDPVYSRPLASFIRDCVAECQQTWGVDKSAIIWQSVDERTRNLLTTYIS